MLSMLTADSRLPCAAILPQPTRAAQYLVHDYLDIKIPPLPRMKVMR